MEKMDTKQMIELCNAHTMWTWNAGKNIDPLPVDEVAESCTPWASCTFRPSSTNCSASIKETE